MLFSFSDQADVVFAIHFSQQSSELDFRYLIGYLRSVLQTTDIDNGAVRIGFYINGGKVLINLKR